MTHYVIAFYRFVPIDDPHQEVEDQKAFIEAHDITSRIYISENGINGQMSATKEDADNYIAWMHSRKPFESLYFKLHPYHEHAFPRKCVKYRKKLVAIDEEIHIDRQAEHVSPEQWKEMLDQEDNKVLLDVRNDYEWAVGHFEGSTLPPCETFREFATYADKLKQEVDPATTPVMMCCTGGIRCELYSSVLLKRGFKKLYQLDGGIINYGLKADGKHWLGKLFVFDDRLTVPISDEKTPTIGTCSHCQAPTDDYYNCANMDCNTLYLSCPTCLKETQGCCQPSCQAAPRVRPYHQQNPHKPFRRKSTFSLH
ncbi:MAG: rhodanese-related sulfurtransferase [Chlamydiia bacterium]|nr:rhodanese-related sulfurtransferase [Chlamydiia bacterium]